MAAARPRRPNLLVVMTDQHKWSATGLHGASEAPTPNLAALAQRGIHFAHAYTPHPLCLPARASFWTGAYPHDHGSRTNETLLDPAQPNFARRFSEEGYELALFGKNHCFGKVDRARFSTWYEVLHFGVLDPADERGRPFREWMAGDEYRGHFRDRMSVNTCPLPDRDCPNHQIGERVADFILERRQREQPYVAWVSFPDPHHPFQATERYMRRHPPDRIELPPWVAGELANKMERQRVYNFLMRFDEEPDARFREVLAAYYAMIDSVDDALGTIVSAVDAAGARDDTIVVFTSDHGEYGGEHRMIAKSSTFYDCMVRVPLVLSWPGHVPEGRVSNDLVSLVDVMPTVADLAGLPLPATERDYETQLREGTLLHARPEIVGGWRLPLREGSRARDAVFAEYGAGGPRLTLETARRLMPAAYDVRAFLRTREAEGRPKMVRTHRWKYVYDPTDPVDELYDLAADRWELRNVAGDAAFRDVVAELRRRLLNWSLSTEDSSPPPLYFDPGTHEFTGTPRFSPRVE